MPLKALKWIMFTGGLMIHILQCMGRFAKLQFDSLSCFHYKHIIIINIVLKTLMFRVLTSSSRLARCRVGGATTGVARSVQWSNNSRHFSDLSKYGNVLGM